LVKFDKIYHISIALGNQRDEYRRHYLSEAGMFLFANFVKGDDVEEEMRRTRTLQEEVLRAVLVA